MHNIEVGANTGLLIHDRKDETDGEYKLIYKSGLKISLNYSTCKIITPNNIE